MSPTATRTLSTAEARREALLEAAIPVIAARGMHGTPTTEIAKAAGISQAYLFRLFPTKRELFIAVVKRCFERTAATFSEAARRAREAGEPVLGAMGRAYEEMVTTDRETLLVQLHCYAACDDPAVRKAVRRGFAGLFALVARESGASPEELRGWFAAGMLINVLAAMDAEHVDAPWAEILLLPDPCD